MQVDKMKMYKKNHSWYVEIWYTDGNFVEFSANKWGNLAPIIRPIWDKYRAKGA